MDTQNNTPLTPNSTDQTSAPLPPLQQNNPASSIQMNSQNQGMAANPTPSVPPIQPTAPLYASPVATPPPPPPLQSSSLSGTPVVPTSTPVDSGSTPENEGQGKSGKIIFIIIFILIVFAMILGYVLYTQFQNNNKVSSEIIPPVMPVGEPSPTEAVASESAIEMLETVSSTDEISDLDNDINANDFSNIDEDLTALEKEL